MINQHQIQIPIWPFAYGTPGSTGKIKSIADDFVVEEKLSFLPEGKGEHVFLLIEKKGENTDYVARLLARFANVRQRDVSYAGLKDRHARTIQWFSVWLPGKDDPDWKQVETQNIKVLKTIRHARKLKRGVLSGNYFQIVVRQLQGDKDKLEQQLKLIKEVGMPNYFGPQRFGQQGQNISKVLALFQGAKVKREQRSLYLSAARSYIFNQILAIRVKAENWNQAVAGDCFGLDQSKSYFKVDQLDDSILQRIKSGDIHPTGALFGKGEIETSEEAFNIEQDVFNVNKSLTNGLISYDLKMDRRALRVLVSDFSWEFQQDSVLLLRFFLPSGSYATSLLREVLNS